MNNRHVSKADVTQQKLARIKEHNDARRTPVTRAQLRRFFKPERDGNHWQVFYRGTLLRNKNREELFNDYATIFGYIITDNN